MYIYIYIYMIHISIYICHVPLSVSQCSARGGNTRWSPRSGRYVFGVDQWRQRICSWAWRLRFPGRCVGRYCIQTYHNIFLDNGVRETVRAHDGYDGWDFLEGPFSIVRWRMRLSSQMMLAVIVYKNVSMIIFVFWTLTSENLILRMMTVEIVFSDDVGRDYHHQLHCWRASGSYKCPCNCPYM